MWYSLTMKMTLEFEFPDELDEAEVRKVLRDLIDVSEVEQAVIETIGS